VRQRQALQGGWRIHVDNVCHSSVALQSGGRRQLLRCSELLDAPRTEAAAAVGHTAERIQSRMDLPPASVCAAAAGATWHSRAGSAVACGGSRSPRRTSQKNRLTEHRIMTPPRVLTAISAAGWCERGAGRGAGKRARWGARVRGPVRLGLVSALSAGLIDCSCAAGAARCIRRRAAPPGLRRPPHGSEEKYDVKLDMLPSDLASLHPSRWSRRAWRHRPSSNPRPLI
jgi:hypothetical protein